VVGANRSARPRRALTSGGFQPQPDSTGWKPVVINLKLLL
jgi:hypothetical protein